MYRGSKRGLLGTTALDQDARFWYQDCVVKPSPSWTKKVSNYIKDLKRIGVWDADPNAVIHLLADPDGDAQRAGLNLKRWTGTVTNLFLNSGSPATQTITVSNATVYTISLYGSGSAVASGAGVGTATAGSPFTFKSTTTSLTVTISGSPTACQVVAMDVPGNYIATAGSSASATQTLRRYALKSKNGTTWTSTEFRRVSPATNALALWKDGTYKTQFAQHVPRFTDLGLTVEEARDNKIAYSSGPYATQWSNAGGNSTVLDNQIVGPDATVSAGSITNANTGNSYYIYKDTTSLENTTAHTISVYIKAGANVTIGKLRVFNTNSVFTDSTVQLTFSSGAVGYGGGASSSNAGVVVCGNGWYRLWVTLTSGAAAASRVGVEIGSNAIAGQTLYVWNMQVEPGSSASTPIITTSGSVTRAADVASHPNPPQFAIGGLPISLVGQGAMFAVPSGASSVQTIVGVDSNSTTDRLALFADRVSVSGKQISYATTAGSNLFSQTAARATAGTQILMAAAGNVNDGDTVIDGVAEAHDNAIDAMGVQPFHIGIGHASSGSFLLNGTVTGFAVFPSAKLSAAQLAAFPAFPMP